MGPPWRGVVSVYRAGLREDPTEGMRGKLKIKAEKGKEADSLISPSILQICPPGPHSARSKGVPATAAFASAAGGPVGFLPLPYSSRVSPRVSARGRCPLHSWQLSPPTLGLAASLSPASLATW